MGLPLTAINLKELSSLSDGSFFVAVIIEPESMSLKDLEAWSYNLGRTSPLLSQLTASTAGIIVPTGKSLVKGFT